jgi:hypothetical protein
MMVFPHINSKAYKNKNFGGEKMAGLKIINKFEQIGGPSITADGCGISKTIHAGGHFPESGYHTIERLPCTITLTPNRQESPNWGCKCECLTVDCVPIPFEDGKWSIHFVESVTEDETSVPIDDDDATVTVGEHQTC